MPPLLKTAVRITTLLIVLFHIVQTAIYVLPKTGVPPGVTALNKQYMDPYFTQTWTLFAPRPIRTNDTLLVKCLSPGSAVSDNRWSDLLSPIWRANQRLRLAAYGQLARTITEPILRIIHPSATLLPLARLCVAGNKNACEQRTKLQLRIATLATQDLVRIASVYCRDQTQPATGRYSEVRLRVRVTFPPDWAHRNDSGATRVKEYDLGVYPVASVNAPKIYAAQ